MDEIEKTLTRGVEQILPSKEGLANLMKKRKITLYQGFDPSTSNLHIGHLIGIRKLAQFQKLGHKVIFLIGDFTGMIGDPTDKKATRKKLTRKKVLQNAKDYKKQISRILKFSGKNQVELKFNSEWLSKLSFEDVVELASNFTAQQMLERNFFRTRLKEQKPIYLHEFLYPLMQGYDCVAMDVDLEIGGNDQLFNMMAGRVLMKTLKDKEKYVLTMKLLEDPMGAKMGKTQGNTINLTDEPNDIFGKIMALPDTLIAPAIELLTDLSLDLVKSKPMDAKKKLAFDVVSQTHGEEKANKAQQNFVKTFQKRAPDYKIQVPKKKTLAATSAPFTSLASISDAKRYISQGSVVVNNKKVTDPTYKPQVGDKIKIGKTVFGTVVKK